jgi:hypothetical protein
LKLDLLISQAHSKRRPIVELEARRGSSADTAFIDDAVVRISDRVPPQPTCEVAMQSLQSSGKMGRGTLV